MKIEKLLRFIEAEQIKGKISPNLEISDVGYHSGKLGENSIFVAIKGYETDGHKYIKDAIKNGAVAAVVERFTDDEIPQIQVHDSRKALADLSAGFFKNPSEELNAIGITGTNGKTTTAFMTNKIFKEHGLETGLVGTVEVQYKDVSIPSILTTPESRDLQFHCRNMVDAGITDLIMEVSSHALEMSRVRNMDFDVVTFNNLSREHIDQHGSFENYYRIKSQLVINAKKDSYVILNFDVPRIEVLQHETRGNVLSYSFENNDRDFGIENLDLSTGFPKFNFRINRDIPELNLKKDSYPIELGVGGYSSVMNSVVAIIISLIRGIKIETIQKALKEFKGVERRFQIIYDKNFTVVDDHFANSRNIDVTMETLEKMNYKNLHIIYGIRGNRGVNLNRETAETTAKWLKKLGLNKIYSSSSIETVTWKDKVAPEEKKVFDEVMKKNDIEVIHHDRLDDGIYDVIKEVEEGDLLLLAGCQGMDPGGRILLEKITEDLEKEEKTEILKILEGRAF